MTIIDDLKAQIKDAQDKIKQIQEACPHPLIVRETKNHGVTGNYDDPQGTYWTEHKCNLCEHTWTTDQSWKNTGDKLGLPVKKS
jgi:hypothetical protein